MINPSELICLAKQNFYDEYRAENFLPSQTSYSVLRFIAGELSGAFNGLQFSKGVDKSVVLRRILENENSFSKNASLREIITEWLERMANAVFGHTHYRPVDLVRAGNRWFDEFEAKLARAFDDDVGFLRINLRKQAIFVR